MLCSAALPCLGNSCFFLLELDALCFIPLGKLGKGSIHLKEAGWQKEDGVAARNSSSAFRMLRRVAGTRGSHGCKIRW